MVTAIAKLEPDMMSGSSWQTLDNETLATFVKEGIRQAHITADAILGLRQRFFDLPKKQTIDGCRTWTEFCKERLRMSDRQARRMIQRTEEKNPAAKHDGSANRMTKAGKPHPAPPWSAKTADGSLIEVVNSAFQKAVRRGKENKAIYYIKQLYFAERKVWKKLFVLCPEDVGLGDLSVKRHILEYAAMAKECEGDGRNSDLLHVIAATMVLCRWIRFNWGR